MKTTSTKTAFRVSPTGAANMVVYSWDEVYNLIPVFVPKARYSKPKAAHADMAVGDTFKVTSRDKTCNDYAIVEVIEVYDTDSKSFFGAKDDAPKADPAPKAKGSKTPDGVRAVSWKYMVELLEVIPSISTVEVRRVNDRRFAVDIDGEMVWFSPKEDVADAMATAIYKHYEGEAPVADVTF